MRKKNLKWLFLLLSITLVAARCRIKTVYQWTQLEYDYANESERQHAIDTGGFVPRNCYPLDTDVHYNADNHGTVFISSPRLQSGIPATLGIVTDRVYQGNPIIAPFPSWSWHKNPEACSTDRLLSVLRVKVDECQRLWLVDTGRIGFVQLCPPQIIAFDLNTNNVVHRYEIPADQVDVMSVFVNPIVDVRNGCSNTFLYISDSIAYALIVYDVQKSTSWKITDATFLPNPLLSTYNVSGYSFQLLEGIIGMALSPYKHGNNRILYYHALTSNSEQKVYTSYLRNETMFINNSSPAPEIFHVYSGRRYGHSSVMAIDSNGIAFFGIFEDITMNCWNTATEYDPDNIHIVVRDTDRLQFPTGVKILTRRKGWEELWTITIRFQKIITDTLNLREINFRIMFGDTRKILKGSGCLRHH